MPVSEHKDWKDLLRRWLGGETNRREESQLEKLARSDTFLSEALEGYREFPEANHLEDLSNLKAKLRGKYQKREPRILPMWRIAAAAAIFVGVIGAFWWLNQGFENQSALALDNSTVEKTESVAETSPESQNEPVSQSEESDEIFEENPVSKPTAEPIKQNKPTPKSQKPTDKVMTSEPPAASSPQRERIYTTDADIAEPISVPEEKIASKKVAEEVRQKRVDSSKNQPSEIIFMDAEKALADIFEEGSDYEPSKEKKDTQISGDVKGETEELPQTLQNSLLTGTPSPTEPKKIKGQVTDPYGAPLRGANVVIPGTETGTVTDTDGNFSLDITGKDQTLEVNFLGYEPQIVPVDSQFLYQIELYYSGVLEEAQLALKSKNRRSENGVASRTNLPVPKGGYEKFMKYLEKNLKYPPSAAEKDVKGEVILIFFVNKNGSINNIRVHKSLSPECDEEAIRVLKNGPKWKTKSARDMSWTFSFSKQK